MNLYHKENEENYHSEGNPVCSALFFGIFISDVLILHKCTLLTYAYISGALCSVSSKLCRAQLPQVPISCYRCLLKLLFGQSEVLSDSRV